MVNPFRGSIIKKANRALFKSSLDKSGLVKKAGSTGFSGRQMNKELKAAGYAPNRRKEMMNKMLGKNKNVSGSTPEQIKNNLRSRMQRDTSALEENIDRAKYGALGIIGGAKGSQTLGSKKTGFAGQPQSGRKTSSPPPKKPISKPPSIGF